MDEFVNRNEAAKILGITKGIVKRYVNPISPFQGVIFRRSDVMKVKKLLEKNPLKKGRPKKIKS